MGKALMKTRVFSRADPELRGPDNVTATTILHAASLAEVSCLAGDAKTCDCSVCSMEHTRHESFTHASAWLSSVWSDYV